MNDPRLTQLVQAAILIARDMQASRGTIHDPRPAALECLLSQALVLDAPAQPSGPPDTLSKYCINCELPATEMDWHPTDNRNICPRCATPLRP